MTRAAWVPRTGADAPTLADMSEEDVLTAFASSLRLARADIGPGDDAAVLASISGRAVITTDSMVCGLDWRDDWSSPQDVGRKIIAQNIADVVAMGAHPVGVVVSLAADRATRVDWIVALTEGMSWELERAGTGVLGGDLSGLPEGVVLTVTALGELAAGDEPLLRSQARVGDLVVVSERLGRSHAGLLWLQEHGLHGADESSGFDAVIRECVAFHRAPWPRYTAGEEARVTGVRCALDVSDGLLRDAQRIARASGVGIDLDASAVNEMARAVRSVAGERAVECVLAGGEEHALLGTCRPGRVPDGWSVVGEVVPGREVTIAGSRAEIRGWDHFGG